VQACGSFNVDPAVLETFKNRRINVHCITVVQGYNKLPLRPDGPWQSWECCASLYMWWLRDRLGSFCLRMPLHKCEGEVITGRFEGVCESGSTFAVSLAVLGDVTAGWLALAGQSCLLPLMQPGKSSAESRCCPRKLDIARFCTRQRSSSQASRWCCEKKALHGLLNTRSWHAEKPDRGDERC
jgi:hypothetical protein